jgi:hypothetical protein
MMGKFTFLLQPEDLNRRRFSGRSGRFFQQGFDKPYPPL